MTNEEISADKEISANEEISADEEILADRLCVLLNGGAFVDHFLVIIDNDTLWQLKGKELDYSNPVTMITKSPTLLELNPPLDYYRSGCAWWGSTLFLFGGIEPCFPDLYRQRIYFADKLSEKAFSITLRASEACESADLALSSELPPIKLNEHCPCSAVVDGKIHVFRNTYEYPFDSDPWAYVFDIDSNKWSPLKLEDSCELAGWRVKDCILWDSTKHMKKLIILQLVRTEEYISKQEEEGITVPVHWFCTDNDTGVPDNCEHPYKSDYVKFQIYDMAEHKLGPWAYAVALPAYSSRKYFLMEVGDALFQASESEWYVYDLPEMRIRGKIAGLERISELPYMDRKKLPEFFCPPQGIVYIGKSSQDKILFCMIWIVAFSPEDALYFAIVEVDGVELTATISSLARVQLGVPCYVTNCFVTTWSMRCKTMAEKVLKGLRGLLPEEENKWKLMLSGKEERLVMMRGYHPQSIWAGV